MAFTMHSHSGQFCPGHAKDELEAIIQHAISVGFQTIGLTEHMPRLALSDLYPEELDDPVQSLAELKPRHEAYLTEAVRLREAYKDQIHILIGFEAEWLGRGREKEYTDYIIQLYQDPRADYFIGSVHHVDGYPIDLDKASYAKAVTSIATTAPGGEASTTGENAAPTEAQEEAFFAEYYDRQHDMLLSLQPQVVGHFDLVRLLSAAPDRDIKAWSGVWDRIMRNLRYIQSYGGWLELNTSALRKGLSQPYPGRAIAELWTNMGGKFTVSDDSHGIAQVATNYLRALDYLEDLGVAQVWTLEHTSLPQSPESKHRKTVEKCVTLAEFRSSLRLA